MRINGTPIWITKQHSNFSGNVIVRSSFSLNCHKLCLFLLCLCVLLRDILEISVFTNGEISGVAWGNGGVGRKGTHHRTPVGGVNQYSPVHVWFSHQQSFKLPFRNQSTTQGCFLQENLKGYLGKMGYSIAPYNRILGATGVEGAAFLSAILFPPAAFIFFSPVFFL